MPLVSERAKIETLDPGKLHEILATFPEQLEAACVIAGELKTLATQYKPIMNVVIAGMGGSAIGAEVVLNATRDICSVPMVISRSYAMPHYVNKDSLVVISSYSGNTEETVEAYRDARAKGAQVLVISSGGQVAQMAAEGGDVWLEIPGGMPPRQALGYSIVPLLFLLNELGVAEFHKHDLEEAITLLRDLANVYGAFEARNNLARELAEAMKGKLLVFYAHADHFSSVALRWRGQLEENSKQLASHHVISEMNHNEISGWSHPANMIEKFTACLLRDVGEPERIKLRMDLTAKVIRESGASVLEVVSRGKSLLARILSLIYLGDYVSYYLALLNDEDPSAIRAIDQLKQSLSNKGEA